MRFVPFLCVVMLSSLGASAWAAPPNDADLLFSAASPAAVQARLAHYAKVDLRLRAGTIADELQPMLAPLRKAADAIDRVFWNQISADGLAMLEVLNKSANPDARQLARLLAIHYGPWDGHADDAPFIGRQRRPPGANFYPNDTSSREVDDWIANHPESAPALMNPLTVVARKGGGFEGIAYAKAYAADLATASAALRDAADAYKCTDAHKGACRCKEFAEYLRARADALLSDDYAKSERMWMDTGTCPLDIAIGPYEVYEDRLFGVKRAYEAIIYYRDAHETSRFEKLIELDKELAAKLPVPDHVRARFDISKPSPIVIADVLYTSGDARSGYQIRAFSLPNDETIRAARGTKNVILRNVVRAKFDALARAVAGRIFEPDMADVVTFDAYFQFLVTWQLSHGMVAKPVEAADKTVRSAQSLLRARFPVIQSLQGEVVALLNFLYLNDKGLLTNGGAATAQTEQAMIATYLASLVDSVRISEGSPQTVARTVVYNWLVKAYAFTYKPETHTFEVGREGMRVAVGKLASEALEIQATGDYERAGRLIINYGLMPGELREKVTALADVPLDILPNYLAISGR